MDLDSADLRLNQTLEQLRNSIVDPAFIPESEPQQQITVRKRNDRYTNGHGNGVAIDERTHAENDSDSSSGSTTAAARARTLHDFVEDEGIENLKSRLRHSIDYVQVGPSFSSPTLSVISDIPTRQ